MSIECDVVVIVDVLRKAEVRSPMFSLGGKAENVSAQGAGCGDTTI
jgi:hypothetical protein|tara:strand:+ start:5641 stop:5778 length:138 start_codon:yes stop_codon:yes gene_type:complete